MRDRFIAAWRTAAQVLIPLLIGVLANRGIHIPDQLSGWLQVAAIAAAAGVWAFTIHWLQSRTGTGPLARAARWLGQILVLGVGTAPTYDAPAAPQPAIPTYRSPRL